MGDVVGPLKGLCESTGLYSPNLMLVDTFLPNLKTTLYLYKSCVSYLKPLDQLSALLEGSFVSVLERPIFWVERGGVDK